MNVRVRLFAAFRERAGAPFVDVSLGSAATVADLVAAIGQQVPALGAVLGAARPVVNHEFADPARAIGPDDEIALLPPVSGGALPDHTT